MEISRGAVDKSRVDAIFTLNNEVASSVHPVLTLIAYRMAYYFHTLLNCFGTEYRKLIQPMRDDNQISLGVNLGLSREK
jgi:hypothetical protein